MQESQDVQSSINTQGRLWFHLLSWDSLWFHLLLRQLPPGASSSPDLVLGWGCKACTPIWAIPGKSGLQRQPEQGDLLCRQCQQGFNRTNNKNYLIAVGKSHRVLQD